MENIYKVTHFYDKNHDESCFFIKTKLTEDQMIEILATVMFKFEDLVDTNEDFETKKMINILEKFYPIKNVSEECKKYIKDTRLEEDDWQLLNYFIIENQTIILIDLYEAREYCCGKRYYELMKQELPSSEEYKKEILLLK